jgi:preprotein translocase subunit Sss1
MRVTMTQRKCPHCGFPVTPEEIDRQNSGLGCHGWGCLIILIIALVSLGVFWIASTPGAWEAVVGLLMLVVLGIVGFVIYAIRSTKRTDEKKNAFLVSPDYQLIKDFARSEIQYEEGARDKLYELIQMKGWDFASGEMDALIEKEWEEWHHAEQTEWITKQLQEKRLGRFDDCVKAYAELTHPHEDEYIHVLAAFLKVGEAEYPLLREELARLSLNPELDDFERRLRGGE